jgi:PAS domain S-box-containing protein
MDILMRLSAESKFSAGLGVALVLLILTILGEQRPVARLQLERHWVEHTHQVIELLQSTLLSVDGAAMSQRAYLITGSRRDLEAYRPAVQVVAGQLRHIRILTADNPRQQRRLDLLEQLVSARFGYLQRVIDARQANGVSAVQAAPLFNSDGAAASRIAQCVAGMEAEERALLKTRQAALDKINQRTREFGDFGTIMALVLLSVAGTFLFRDISGRQRASRAMAEQAERLRQQAQLLDLTQDAIFVRRFDDQILFWNHGAERLYGWTKEEALAGTSYSLLKTAFLIPFAEIQAQLLGSGFWEGELIHTGKDGRCLTVASRWALRRDETGNPTGILETNNDITERKQTEEDLAEKSRELERSNAELSQFAYVASHDLQEPLRMVSSYVQLLARRYQGQLGAEADEFIRYAVDGVVRMHALIQDLLAYSRVNTKVKSFEPVNVREPLGRALANLEGAIEESGASVKYDGLPTVPCDASQLTQLFQNLVGNAIKYRGEEPPHISVEANANGKEWIFSVQDNGIGIDPQYYDRIFTIFQRLHTRQEYPGTGIGLAICKKIVERHGGRIWVESQPGSGSAFYFTMAKV